MFLPDIWGEAESGCLLPQSGQGGPAFSLQAHQLRVAQDLLHQLPVPAQLLLSSLQGGRRISQKRRDACQWLLALKAK